MRILRLNKKLKLCPNVNEKPQKINVRRNRMIVMIRLARNERRSEPILQGAEIIYRLGPRHRRTWPCDSRPCCTLVPIATLQRTHLPRRHRDKLAEPLRPRQPTRPRRKRNDARCNKRNREALHDAWSLTPQPLPSRHWNDSNALQQSLESLA